MNDDEKKVDKDAVLEFLQVIGQIAQQGIDQIYGRHNAHFSFHLFADDPSTTLRITDMRDEEFLSRMDGVLDDIDANLEAQEKSKKILFQSPIEGYA